MPDALRYAAELRRAPRAGHQHAATGCVLLYWDRDGFALWAKRLEEGTYAMPFHKDSVERRREIAAQELGALLSGIDLNIAKRRKRYQRKHAEAA